VNRPLAVLRRATAVLDGLGIPYAIGVLRVSGAEMDRRYLAHWSRELGVSDLLERALDEAAHP
jgi:hypothetical protein